MDLVKVIEAEVVAKIESGVVREKVSKHVDTFVDEVLKSALSTWGDVKKGLEKRVEEQLKQSIERVSLQQYNDVIVQMIQSRLETIYVGKATEHLKGVMDEVFQVPKSKYKLSEIVDRVFGEKDDCRCSGDARGSLHIDAHTSLTFIYFDDQTEKKQYDCKYRLVVDSDGVLSSASEMDRYYSKTREAIRPRAGVSLSRFEAELFQMVVHGVEVEIDIESDYVNPDND